MVTLAKLNEYQYLKREIRDLKEDIARKEKELREIIEGETVIDSVSGGYGGTQHFRIEGIPFSQIDQKRRLLEKRKNRMEQLIKSDLLITEEIEEYIAHCPDVQIRLILKWRFIDNMTWNKVALKLGGGNTDDAAKKMLYRYLEKTKTVPNV